MISYAVGDCLSGVSGRISQRRRPQRTGLARVSDLGELSVDHVMVTRQNIQVIRFRQGPCHQEHVRTCRLRRTSVSDNAHMHARTHAPNILYDEEHIHYYTIIQT